MVSLRQRGENYPVQHQEAHPQFRQKIAKNDIGLVTVRGKIRFTSLIQPIPLANANVIDNQQCIVAGWGKSKQNGATSPNLQYIIARVWSTQKCKQSQRMKSFKVTDTNVCTFNKKGEGACGGDSGGPLVANWRLIGIVSWGGRCGSGSPDIFTKVSSYVKWIDDSTGTERATKLS